MIELQLIQEALIISQYLSNNNVYLFMLNLFLLIPSKNLLYTCLFLFITILQESMKFNRFIELILFDILFYYFCVNKFAKTFIIFLNIIMIFDLLYYMIRRGFGFRETRI
jgi:hypothetical protein